MLRRHVTTAHGLSVEEYRARWNLRLNSFLGSDIFDGKLGALRQGFRQQNERAASAHSMSRAFDGLSLAGNFDSNRYTQQNALSAAALLRS